MQHSPGCSATTTEWILWAALHFSSPLLLSDVTPQRHVRANQVRIPERKYKVLRLNRVKRHWVHLNEGQLKDNGRHCEFIFELWLASLAKVSISLGNFDAAKQTFSLPQASILNFSECQLTSGKFKSSKKSAGKSIEGLPFFSDFDITAII